MIGLTIVLVGLALIGFGIAVKRMGDKVINEILAAELRQIERDRQRGISAGIAAMDAMGKEANR